MKIRTITVDAGRTISPSKAIHYGIRPHVGFTAELEDGEDAFQKARELHIKAEQLIEDQVDELLTYAAVRQNYRQKRLRDEKPEEKKQEPLVA